MAANRPPRTIKPPLKLRDDDIISVNGLPNHIEADLPVKALVMPRKISRSVSLTKEDTKTVNHPKRRASSIDSSTDDEGSQSQIVTRSSPSAKVKADPRSASPKGDKSGAVANGDAGFEEKTKSRQFTALKPRKSVDSPRAAENPAILKPSKVEKLQSKDKTPEKTEQGVRKISPARAAKPKSLTSSATSDNKAVQGASPGSPDPTETEKSLGDTMEDKKGSKRGGGGKGGKGKGVKKGGVVKRGQVANTVAKKLKHIAIKTPVVRKGATKKADSVKPDDTSVNMPSPDSKEEMVNPSNPGENKPGGKKAVVKKVLGKTPLRKITIGSKVSKTSAQGKIVKNTENKVRLKPGPKKGWKLKLKEKEASKTDESKSLESSKGKSKSQSDSEQTPLKKKPSPKSDKSKTDSKSPKKQQEANVLPQGHSTNESEAPVRKKPGPKPGWKLLKQQAESEKSPNKKDSGSSDPNSPAQLENKKSVKPKKSISDSSVKSPEKSKDKSSVKQSGATPGLKVQKSQSDISAEKVTGKGKSNQSKDESPVRKKLGPKAGYKRLTSEEIAMEIANANKLKKAQSESSLKKAQSDSNKTSQSSPSPPSPKFKKQISDPGKSAPSKAAASKLKRTHSEMSNSTQGKLSPKSSPKSNKAGSGTTPNSDATAKKKSVPKPKKSQSDPSSTKAEGKNSPVKGEKTKRGVKRNSSASTLRQNSTSDESDTLYSINEEQELQQPRVCIK